MIGLFICALNGFYAAFKGRSFLADSCYAYIATICEFFFEMMLIALLEGLKII